MSNHNDNRVLGRMGARQLAHDELEQVSGGGTNTRASLTLTGPASNPDTGMDS
jgi:hypothetical protein